MYTTQNNRQRKRQLDREEEEVSTDRKMYTTQNNRQRDSLQRGGGGRYKLKMYTTQNNRLKERQLDREEEEEVATDRQMYTTQNNRSREIVRQRGGGGRYR